MLEAFSVEEMRIEECVEEVEVSKLQMNISMWRELHGLSLSRRDSRDGRRVANGTRAETGISTHRDRGVAKRWGLSLD